MAALDIDIAQPDQYCGAVEALVSAAEKGDVLSVQLLLDFEEEELQLVAQPPTMVNRVSQRTRETALHAAAYRGHCDVAALLVSRGADVNARSLAFLGCTPLHSAAAGGHIGVLMLMLSSGSDVNAVSDSGWTPLHSAASRGNKACMRILLSCGASTELKTEGGNTYKDVLLSPSITEPLYHSYTAETGEPKWMERRTQSYSAESHGSVAVQYCSDVHLEFFKNDFRAFDEIVRPSAPVLALLGDIGIPGTEIYRAFLLWCASQFDVVFVVHGNHEFYNPPTARMRQVVQRRKEIIAEVCAEHPALIYADCTAVDVDGVLFLGCCFWTYVPEEIRATVAHCGMNDYELISVERGGDQVTLTPALTSLWHAEEVRWMRAHLRRATQKGMSVAVLTHHPPSFDGTAAPEYRGDPFVEYQSGGSVQWTNFCFASRSEYLFAEGQGKIRVWLSGHTHYNYKHHVKGVWLAANQHGYRGTAESRVGFDEAAVFNVQSYDDELL